MKNKNKNKYEYINGKLQEVVEYSHTYYKCCQKIFLHKCEKKYCKKCPEFPKWVK